MSSGVNRADLDFRQRLRWRCPTVSETSNDPLREHIVKQNMVAGVGLVIALVVVLAGLFVVPALQDAQRTVDSQAAEQVEYAYRLLSRYNAQLGRSEGLLAELRGFEDLAVDVDFEEPDELVEAAGDRYQEEYEVNWEDHPPKNPEDLPRCGSASVRQLSGTDSRRDQGTR